MGWLKSMALSLLKKEVAAHLDLLDALLKPRIVDALSKAKIDPSQSGALADAIVAIVKTEVNKLVEKL